MLNCEDVRFRSHSHTKLNVRYSMQRILGHFNLHFSSHKIDSLKSWFLKEIFFLRAAYVLVKEIFVNNHNVN